MSENQLTTEIIARSVASTWEEAKLEWTLKEVYKEREPLTCLCGHFPINEICVLHNAQNGEEALVGNVCVKKFLGLPSDKIFAAIRRITEDETNALNAEAIDHAHRSHWINDWERTFCFDTCRKRRLSEKQMSKRIQINRAVLARVVNQLGNRKR